MKPKNRVFCLECGRSKLLFETEKKAKLFIRYNASEIKQESEENKAPIRAYYCETCGGWHTTSREAKPWKEKQTQNVIDAFERSKNFGKEFDKKIKSIKK